MWLFSCVVLAGFLRIIARDLCPMVLESYVRFDNSFFSLSLNVTGSLSQFLIRSRQWFLQPHHVPHREHKNHSYTNQRYQSARIYKSFKHISLKTRPMRVTLFREPEGRRYRQDKAKIKCYLAEISASKCDNCPTLFPSSVCY